MKMSSPATNNLKHSSHKKLANCHILNYSSDVSSSRFEHAQELFRAAPDSLTLATINICGNLSFRNAPNKENEESQGSKKIQLSN